MAYNNPFPRIYLPNKQDGLYGSPVFNQKSFFSKEYYSISNSINSIISDFIKLLDYIEPVEDNKDTYSIKVYELLLRTAVEFEANCVGILRANNYTNKRNWSIVDFHKLDSVMKLSEYEITTSLWQPRSTFKPLSEWTTSHSLSWFKAYNKVKHDRIGNFKCANIRNLLSGICSLIALFAAQFNSFPMRDNIFFIYESNEDTISFPNFSIKFPSFTEDEKYDFDWSKLSKTENPFSYFNFV